MLLEHVPVIHAVELVAREDDEVVVIPLEEGTEILPDRVGGALIPGRALGCLLGGQDLDKAPCETVELVARIDVAVQRGAVELGQHVDAADAGVQAVADRHVDEAVFPPDRNRGLGAILGQRKEACPGAAAHDDGEGAGSRRYDMFGLHRCVFWRGCRGLELHLAKAPAVCHSHKSVGNALMERLSTTPPTPYPPLFIPCAESSDMSVVPRPSPSFWRDSAAWNTVAMTRPGSPPSRRG